MRTGGMLSEWIEPRSNCFHHEIFCLFSFFDESANLSTEHASANLFLPDLLTSLAITPKVRAPTAAIHSRRALATNLGHRLTACAQECHERRTTRRSPR